MSTELYIVIGSLMFLFVVLGYIFGYWLGQRGFSVITESVVLIIFCAVVFTIALFTLKLVM